MDRVPLAAKLVDLPCIIESLKTIDKKTFYKTADICQVCMASASCSSPVLFAHSLLLDSPVPRGINPTISPYSKLICVSGDSRCLCALWMVISTLLWKSQL